MYNKEELIHISCYFRQPEVEQKEDAVILYGEAWRDSNTKKSKQIRIYLKTDLYLDCLSKTDDEDALIHFVIEDSWKALKKVFKNPDFAFVLEDDFEIILETEEGIDLITEF